MPDISVLMCVYNGAKWVKECIDSVLSQKDVDIEFVIINDGSTDSTPYILNSYNDHRLVVIHQENKGLTKALNRGLRIAKGKYVARIDADDVCLPHRLSKQRNFLVQNPEVVLVGSHAILIDENTDEMGQTRYPVTHDSLVERLENFKTVFPHSSIFFKKDVVVNEGGYNELFPKAQDYELYLRLSEKYLLAGLDDYLVKLRITPDSLTYSNDDFLQLKMGISALICHFRRKKQLRDFSDVDKNVWLTFLSQVEDWLNVKNYKHKREAKKYLRRCRTLLKQKAFVKSALALFSCFKNDPMFFLYKDINLKIPKDIEHFYINSSI